LSATLGHKVPWAHQKEVARKICRLTAEKAKRRRYGELCQGSLRPNQQALIQLDGESLCVTPAFLSECGGRVPAWLRQLSQERCECIDRRTVLASQSSITVLQVQRFSAWFSCLRSARPTSPAIRQAGMLFRLERYGIQAPRLLAVGQRIEKRDGRSFILTEPVPGAVPLLEWLRRQCSRTPSNTERKQFRQVLHHLGFVLRHMHHARCFLEAILRSCRKQSTEKFDALFPFQVQTAGKAEVVLGSLEAILVRRRLHGWLARRDVAAVKTLLSRAGCSRTDQLRFLRGYESARANTGKP
jgi:hypothetical protein